MAAAGTHDGVPYSALTDGVRVATNAGSGRDLDNRTPRDARHSVRADVVPVDSRMPVVLR